LADDHVRQGLKEFADWPTYPQLWLNGELVGGLDIVSCGPQAYSTRGGTNIFVNCRSKKSSSQIRIS